MIHRRKFRIKDFEVRCWWEGSHRKLTWGGGHKFGAEVEYLRTGKYKIVFADTKRELIKIVRLQVAIFKNPNVGKVIERFEAQMGRPDFAKLLNDYIPAELLKKELMNTDTLLKRFENDEHFAGATMATPVPQPGGADA